MQSKLLVCIIAASAAVFLSGIAVGQRTSSSKFAKYLRPANQTEMNVIEIDANMNAIRDRVQRGAHISIPQTRFNYTDDRPESLAEISTEFEKAPLDVIKYEILSAYSLAYDDLKLSIPELSEDDFVLKIYRHKSDSADKRYAECKHGKIVFH